MKVTQEETKPEFKPITIVLETEDEAKVMRYKLNQTAPFGSLTQRMSEAFNDIYHPEEKK